MAACTQEKQSFTMEVSLEDTEGKWLTLSQRVDREFQVIDSALAEAGNPAVLSGSVEGIESLYLSVKDQRGSIQILAENDRYSISGSMEDPLIETGAKAQSDMNAYKAMSAEADAKLQSIIESYYEVAEKGDSLALDSVLRVYEEVNAAKGQMDSLYLVENPGSAASVIILRSSFYNYDTPQLEELLLSLDESLQGMSEYTYMFGIMEKQKAVAIGNKYVDFGLPTPEGELLKISDVHQGQVLLIDFWASWCGPCRRANPEVVAMYKQFHEQGFEIIGVSLDRNKEDWLKAIEDDKLTWHHISDIKFWDCEGAKLYGVPAIPHTVLIDREGVIRHKNLHGAEMEEAIASLL